MRAVKELIPSSARNPWRRRWFMFTHTDKILRYYPNHLEGVETEKELFIVTETVAPLQDWIKQARASNSTAQYEAALAWGLRCICGALDFLNNDCKLIHGFVCSESIFVTPGGDWKLGRLDLVPSMKRHGPDTIFTYNTNCYHRNTAPPNAWRAAGPRLPTCPCGPLMSGALAACSTKSLAGL